MLSLRRRSRRGLCPDHDTGGPGAAARLNKRDRASAIQVGQAIGLLLEAGPELGRPLADRVHHSRLSNLKELRPGSAGRSEIRILYIFDPRRNAVLVVAGDKAGKWEAWYRQAIPLAEQRYEDYLKQEDIDEQQRVPPLHPG
jgi:hypothetical protein